VDCADERGRGNSRGAALSLDKSEQVTAATKPGQHCREGQIAWEPDSKALAFFSIAPSRSSPTYILRGWTAARRGG